MNESDQAKSVEALLEAASIVGSQSLLAEKLQVTKGAVSHWVNKRRAIPLGYCREIERLTGVRRERLRPDFAWVTGRRKPASVA